MSTPTGNIRRCLIANRGEIALRILRSLEALGIESVAVYHAGDRHAPFVQRASVAVEIEGATPSAAHLDVRQLVAIAEREGADAVHPGYGFLAENAGFARAVEAAGIRFVGPRPEVIELMGDKVRARTFVRERGFPVSQSVVLDRDGTGRDGSALGFPLVVKASAGGGGQGMRVVRSAEELDAAARATANTAAQYFGDPTVYAEPYLERARHVEVQVLGDGEGRIVHVGERDCSLQRRFQKLVEESPAPAMPEVVRAALCETAAGIAAAAGYTSAGTVEFLYTAPNTFYFLEMNTRIQVEHPVTELVSGIDLVAEQLRVAAGEPLSFTQDDVRLEGHALECRIYAEDPAADFAPATGRVLALSEPAGVGIRFDSGLYPGQHVGTGFDPLLAKLVTHGPDRDTAIERARQALRETVILGLTTNVDYLADVLEHPDFRAASLDTEALAHWAAALTRPAPGPAERRALLAAAVLADADLQALRRATPEPYLAIGRWRN